MFRFIYKYAAVFILFVIGGVVRATGLDGVFMSEKLFFKSQESGIVGMVFNIEESGVSIATVGKGETSFQILQL